MPWVLNSLYLLLLLAVSPVLLYRRARFGKYRDGWGEKLWGRVAKCETPAPRVWFHAVSVGEILQLEQVIGRFRSECPDWEIVISTTTSTGHRMAQERFPDLRVFYFPLDFSWAVSEAIARIHPSLVVLVELELWPNFINAVAKQGVPLALINGRLSERSFRGYRRIKPIVRSILRRFAWLGMQTETYAERVFDLGADPQSVSVTGSVKFDDLECNQRNPRTQELRTLLGIGSDERVFIAGSTLAPEESVAVTAWQQARERFPDLRLIVVPRHEERFDDVARLLAQEFQVPYLRRSELRPGADVSGRPVILLDTLGELADCWGLADMAFVGGSMVPPRGGQSMIEPAAYGVPVLFGPDTANFQDLTDELLAANAASVVRDADELAQTLCALLAAPETADEIGERAQSIVRSRAGASQRTVAGLWALVPRSGQNIRRVA